MEVIRIMGNDDNWESAIQYAANCSWDAGKHLADMMLNNYFNGWESVFIAMESDEILGFCTLMKEDYYPDNKYFHWISTIFVDERARGKRISHKMIESAVRFAQIQGFGKVYIPSDMTGFYEKCGFSPIDTLQNYAGDVDTIFMKEI